MKSLWNGFVNFVTVGYRRSEKIKYSKEIRILTALVIIGFPLGIYLMECAGDARDFDWILGLSAVSIHLSVVAPAFVLLIILKCCSCGWKNSLIGLIMSLALLAVVVVIGYKFIYPMGNEIYARHEIARLLKGERLEREVYLNAYNYTYTISLPEGTTAIPDQLNYIKTHDNLAHGILILPNTVTAISGLDLDQLDNYECIELPDNFHFVQSVQDGAIMTPHLQSLTRVVWRGKTYTEADLLQKDLLNNGIECPANLFWLSKMDNVSELKNIPLKVDLKNCKYINVCYKLHISQTVILDDDSFCNSNEIEKLKLPYSFELVGGAGLSLETFPKLNVVTYEGEKYEIHDKEQYKKLLQKLRINGIEVADDFIVGF